MRAQFSRGGYSVEPVYAAYFLYKDNGNSIVYTASADNRSKLTSLRLGNIIIDGSNDSSLSINSVGSSNEMPEGTISINGFKFEYDDSKQITFTGTGIKIGSDTTVNYKDLSNAVVNTGGITRGKDANQDYTTIEGIIIKGDGSSTSAIYKNIKNRPAMFIKESSSNSYDIVQIPDLQVGAMSDLSGKNSVGVENIRKTVDNTQKISYTATSGSEGFTQVTGELVITGVGENDAALRLSGKHDIIVTSEKLATWNDAIQKNANGETIIGGKLSGKDGSKVGGVTFDDYNVSDVDTLEVARIKDRDSGKSVSAKKIIDTVDKTKNISIVQDKYVTSSEATKIEGITVAGGVRLADGEVRGKSVVVEDSTGNNQVGLSYDGLTKLNNLVSGSSASTVIKVGDGSEVGGVKFSNSALDNVKSIKSGFDGIDIAFSKDASTNWNNTTTIESTLSVSEKTAVGSYGNVAINAGEANQVKIGEEGIVVGKNSTVIGSDGVYAGGHTEATAKAVLNADGSIKGASDGAGNYKFSVDGQTGDVWSKGSITANAAGFNNLNVSGGAWIGDTTSRVQIGGGGIIATNGTDSVTIGNGAIVATGAITAKTLNVENIVLGGSMYNKDGTLINGNLSIGSDGHLRAANGNFDVKTDGSFTNNVGNTTLKTTDGKATIANGNASIDVKNGSITDKVGNTTVETKDGSFSVKGKDGKGMDIDTSTGKTTFTGASGTTTIDGNTITTGKLITDDIEIKGSGISLSQIGQLGKLDSELTSRQEYNNTAVGAINAEAAARREDINRLNDSLVAETTARIDDVNRLDQSITDEVNTRKDEVARLDNSISGLRKDINDVSNRVDKVGAMAAAIASLKTMGYDPQAPSEFSVGLGHYKGETGVALGFFHYPNKNFMINVSLSTAGGETMGGIGATWRFGHKSPQKLLDEQRAAQAKHF